MYHGVLASLPAGGSFAHLALARQVLGGDVPVRDFFDGGIPLMYVLSALAEQAVGYRLLSEALLVGAFSGVSVYLAYRVTWDLTASRAAAALVALLLVLAAPRGDAYPMRVIYAGAAALWWGYARAPGTRRLAALGIWTALAFYWRPDHGAYVAAGTGLAIVAALGVTRVAAVAAATAGGIALALVMPFLVFVQMEMGLLAYAQTRELAAPGADLEGGVAVPDWPIRSPGDLVTVEPAETFAPEIGIRWRPGSSAEARQALLARYGATPAGGNGLDTQRVRLSDVSRETLRSLVDAPVVESTTGVDRDAAILEAGAWRRPWHRWRFAHAWLRVEPFPGVNDAVAAGGAVAMLWYLLPLAFALLALRPLRGGLVDGVTPGAIAAFAAFALLVDVGLVRTPYAVRALDAVVLPAILLGCVLAATTRAVAPRGLAVRGPVLAGAVVCAVLAVRSVAVAGDLDTRTSWLAGDWVSRDRARGAWADAWVRLSASPPIDYWGDRPAEAELRLARYTHDCVPESDRLLVLSVAPRIYYYAGRLTAHRHVVPARREPESEASRALARVEHFAPPLVVATTESLEGADGEWDPRLVDYVRQAYDAIDTVEGDGRTHVVLARRDRSVLRTYGPRGWPCYAGGG